MNFSLNGVALKKCFNGVTFLNELFCLVVSVLMNVFLMTSALMSFYSVTFSCVICVIERLPLPKRRRLPERLPLPNEYIFKNNGSTTATQRYRSHPSRVELGGRGGAGERGEGREDPGQNPTPNPVPNPVLVRLPAP